MMLREHKTGKWWQGDILTEGEEADKHRCIATAVLIRGKWKGICGRWL